MLEILTAQASQILQHPYLLYGVLVTASACLVFGVATLLEPRAAMGPSLRRGNSMQWAVTRFSRGLVPEDAREHNELKRSLVQAGYDTPNAVQVYYGIRVILAISLPSILLLAAPAFGVTGKTALIVSPFVAILGFLAPIYWVRSRRSSRQRQFREGLPDVLDLLLVCSEAGLGIDTALLKVSEEMADPHPLLAEELQLISSELRAGLVRAEAMRHFADRTGIDETISLVNLLVQSDALGTSMATTLRAFAQDMRAHRMLRAEDLGHRVGAKLTVVLVGCFLPAMFAALLAPAIYSAITKLHGLSVTSPWPH
jgi:tight adherence protein C